MLFLIRENLKFQMLSACNRFWCFSFFAFLACLRERSERAREKDLNQPRAEHAEIAEKIYRHWPQMNADGRRWGQSQKQLFCVKALKPEMNWFGYICVTSATSAAEIDLEFDLVANFAP